MRFLSLFAGVGGFDLGFERAGMTCAAQVEIYPQSRDVLRYHWPDVHRLPNVVIADANTLPAVDVVVGGFPCQDLSVAGKRAGLAGIRSGLFFEMTRICDELRPAFIVWENVPGLLIANKGRDFGIVLDELDRIGYCGAWTGLDSQHFGLAQRRRRIFGVFARADIGAGPCAEILSFAARLRGHHRAGKQARPEVAGTLGAGTPGSGWADDSERMTFLAEVAAFDERQVTSGENRSLVEPGRPVPTLHQRGSMSIAQVAPTLRSSNARTYTNDVANDPIVAFSSKDDGQGAANDLSPTLRAFGRENGGGQMAVAFEARYARNGRGAPDGIVPPLKAQSGGTGKGDGAPLVATHTVRRLTPTECERLQGFPDGWTAQGRNDAGEVYALADSHRYYQMGNAVSVPVAEWIGRRLLAVAKGLGI